MGENNQQPGETVEQWLERWYGEKCGDYDADCLLCQTWEVYEAARAPLLAALDRVRALHQKNLINDCMTCATDWPCPTIRAVEG